MIVDTRLHKIYRAVNGRHRGASSLLQATASCDGAAGERLEVEAPASGDLPSLSRRHDRSSLTTDRETVMGEPVLGAVETPAPSGRAGGAPHQDEERASRSLAEACGVTSSRCWTRNNSSRLGKAVASAGTRLYAPPQGRKLTSREWRVATPCVRLSTRSEIVSRGSGCRKNSDLVNSWPGGAGTSAAGCPPDRRAIRSRRASVSPLGTAVAAALRRPAPSRPGR
jgi:hypothetical protein